MKKIRLNKREIMLLDQGIDLLKVAIWEVGDGSKVMYDDLDRLKKMKSKLNTKSCN